MHKQWIGCSPTNFVAGRSGFAPEAIVIHQSGVSLAEIDARCVGAKTYNSVHYAVGAAGDVHQYVEEKDTAFQAGVVVNPTWKLIKPGKNPNLYTVGIEQEKLSPGQPADAQYQALAGLILEINGRWKFELDGDHIVLHSEIRAGAGCPQNGFDRPKLLKLIASNGTNGPKSISLPREVSVLKDTNVRECSKTESRIVRVARAHTSEGITGCDEFGERINGNATWYQTEDGNFVWAGATDRPNPVAVSMPRATPLPIASVQSNGNGSSGQAAESGIAGIDQLLCGGQAPAICEKADAEAIGAVQDLLTGLGFSGLPTVLSSGYGSWSAKTLSAIQSFQKQSGLPVAAQIDQPALRKMIATPAVDARASRAYLTLVHRSPFTGLHKILSLVAQMEGAGRFAALNRNTDRAGASFGLIQWAQKPGRLAEVLEGMSAAAPEQFTTVFGAGNALVAEALLTHCRKQFGGLNPKTGETLNPAFNLVEEPWITRFRQAAGLFQFQVVQLELALTAFSKSCALIRQYARELVSERAIGFMLDVANQFGDAGAQKLYNRAHRDGMREADVLQEISEESIAAMDDSLQAGVRVRRERFLETRYLSGEQVFGT